ncbi:hypothetical protein MNBD_NITROSPINAE04-2171 [hydrothermal vent metagenome]|uniref:Uncharacterized protein n=1 Tax=hydrothermal vent metagenome TaxID=652676 RepID=A0A3B1BMI4_9ZZZZ
MNVIYLGLALRDLRMTEIRSQAEYCEKWSSGSFSENLNDNCNYCGR